MQVGDSKEYLSTHQKNLVRDIFWDNYFPAAIRGVENPKSNGKKQLLGIPTALDRWLQQAVSQQLMTRFELEFSDHSYGFTPKKHKQEALQQTLSYIKIGYSNIEDIDLAKYFDKVSHYKQLQLIYEELKCITTLRFIRKCLRTPILTQDRLYKRRKELPQEE